MGPQQLTHTTLGVPDRKGNDQRMNTRRRLVQWATVTVACLASAVPSHGASATAPPTSSVPATPDAQQPPDDQNQPQIEESWALTPAASDDPDAAGNRSELTYLADPGAVIHDAVTVFNFGNVQENFRVYATDAFNNDEGQFDLLPADTQPTDVGTWVTFPQEGITVPPGKQATIPITITIPLDAGAGDHAGAIVASSPTSGTDSAGNVVTLDRRTGSRVYIRVNGPLTADLAVADVETTYDHAVNPFGGTAHVKYRIENRGNVRLTGSVKLSVAGPFGIGEKNVTVPDLTDLLPGQEVTMTADIHDVPQLMFGVTRVRVEPADATGVGADASEKRDVSFVPPMAVLLALLALVFGLFAWRRIRRHRQNDPSGELTRVVEQRPDRVLEQQPT